jgi:UDP-3-O-[3-hydroxymyristoyl] glucosamine N-acyltransferase
MIPTPLSLEDVTLSDLARRHGLELVGEDRKISFLALSKAMSESDGEVLTYATSPDYLEAFIAGPHRSAVVERRFVPSEGIAGKSVLVCPDTQGEETFFQIHINLVTGGQVMTLEPNRGERTMIHPSAVVMDNVQIGDDVVIEPNAVVYPNTVVGDRSFIKANASIGGEGFEIKYLGGRRTLIPHSGGVDLGTDTLVGSSTCIDRGLFGTYTTIGAGTKIDNLVHVGHNVEMGEDCGVVASVEIGGSSRLGRGVWLGGSSSCNHEIQFGDHSYVGTGSVVVRDVPAFTLVAGSPARVFGHVCRCRARLDLEADDACSRCGTRYALGESGEVGIKV